VLLHRDGKIGAALHRRVVDDDDAFAAGDAADAGDDARRGNVAAIHAVSGELRELEKRRAGIEESADALARQELAARQMPLARRGAAALADRGDPVAQIGNRFAQRRGIAAERLGARIDGCLDDGHEQPCINPA